MIVKTPQHPPVNSFKTPIPSSPNINLSISSAPKNMETNNKVVESFNSHAWTVKKVLSSACSSFCLIIGIADGSKYLALVVKYKSIFLFVHNLLLSYKYSRT